MSNRIRITSKMGYRWVWQLVTPDGHVANESGDFENRDACEASALQQGLPVIGLSKARRTSAAARVLNENPQWHFSLEPAAKLWRWQHFGANGQPIASSGPRFAKQSDCIADAKKHGYQPASGRPKKGQ